MGEHSLGRCGQVSSGNSKSHVRGHNSVPTRLVHRKRHLAGPRRMPVDRSPSSERSIEGGVPPCKGIGGLGPVVAGS